MSATPQEAAKQAVAAFWQDAACGEELYLGGLTADDYARQADERYRLEPFIEPFARFDEGRGKDVLEIGVGLGADHQRWAESGANLHGVDLTPRAIEHTRRRLAMLGLESELQVADTEALPFPDGSFDIVYSWGVIHHSPDTARAAQEILRVLRAAGRFSVMVYHRRSMVGYMLWLRYGLLEGRPLLSLDDIFARYLESPGTKAYTRAQAAELFRGASEIRASVVLTHGDLLASGAGQRHRGALLIVARKLWPRWIIRRFFANHGLFLLVEGRKPG